VHKHRLIARPFQRRRHTLTRRLWYGAVR
jgi:hypothetical protein